MLDAFVESQLASELYDRWNDHAHDILPQCEGVQNGDWRKAGYDMDAAFPQVSMLANDFGNEWEEFLSRKDYDSDIVWVVSEDFETLMSDFVEVWRDIKTKEDVEKAIKELQEIVLKSI